MTPAQLKYAKRLRSAIMVTAKTQYGWDSDQAHDMFRAWGYGDHLTALEIDQLLELLEFLRGDCITKPCAPLPEMVGSARPTAKGMATYAQIRYAGVLAARHAELRKIPPAESFTAWHEFVHKYQRIDRIEFCHIREASKVLSVMEKVFITTWGVGEFTALTGKTWALRGTKYSKYRSKTPEDHHPRPRSTDVGVIG